MLVSGVKSFGVSHRIYGHIFKVLNVNNKTNYRTVNCEMNLLNLINPSLANVYFSTILLNLDAITLKRFVSQFTCNIYN